MASNPGFLTDWPWTRLGNFKYIILGPFWAHTLYSIIQRKELEWSNIFITPTLLMRMLHDQIWISYSRYRTAKGTARIVDKSIEFEQVDRERNWDDQILLNGLLLYIANVTVPQAYKLPIWRTDGAIMMALIHAGPVEFLYYWFHRALHHHFLYSRYHSHHHSSIVTEPITSVIHPFAEHIVYFLLFSIPMFTALFTGTLSIISIVCYITYLDVMNNLGHCNFELIPKTLFSIFPPLKYLMYTPSYHSLHHTRFRTNYCLFMPLYDYAYGTMDNSSEKLYEDSLKRKDELPDVIHLTHLTSSLSVYHMRLGFASTASHPISSSWYLWGVWPLSFWSMALSWICNKAFITERNHFKKFKLQTWTVPRYNLQYRLRWQRVSINGMIEEAILEAEKKGCKVVSLGLSNQREEVNGYGEVYIQKHPHLKVKVVDGSSLVVAIVLNHIPKGATQVILQGRLSKVGYAIAYALCLKGIKIEIINQYQHEKLYHKLKKFRNNFSLSNVHTSDVWLIGDELSREEELKAPKGTLFIPYSYFPPKRIRKDCIYHTTPALMAPTSLENIDSCENWLPRRAMSAPRVAGIVHALEGWNVHECGLTMFDVDKIWNATLRQGFQPLMACSP